MEGALAPTKGFKLEEKVDNKGVDMLRPDYADLQLQPTLAFILMAKGNGSRTSGGFPSP